MRYRKLSEKSRCGLSNNNDYIQTVTIPNGVTVLGSYAFYDCDNLISITIPGTVRTIGSNAFNSCGSLEELKIMDGVEYIGDSAFYDCDRILSLALPDSLIEIGSYAFYDCDGLSIVNIPDNVTAINGYAFYSCNNLEEVNAGDNIQTIGTNAFISCPKLIIYCNLDSKIQKYAANNNIPYITSTHVILYTLNKQLCIREGEESKTEIDNINNYNITVFNKTQNKQLSGVKTNAAGIILNVHGVSANDVLEVKLVSKNSETIDYLGEVVLDEKMNGNIEIVTLQKGYIKADVNTNSDISVFAYNSEGKLANTLSKVNAEYVSNYLDEGEYTIVFIKGSTYLWQFDTINGFVDAGLVENAHYITKSVTVQNGIESVLDTVTVPKINEDLLKYLETNKSSYTVNTTEISAGGILNMRLEYAFKDIRAENVSNMNITINIPSGTTYVANSLTVNGIVSNEVTENEASISLAVNEKSGVIRFSVRPVENKTLVSSATISFRGDGRYFTEMIGSISVNVPYITLSGPSTSNTESIKVSGITSPNTVVAVYDGEKRIATAHSNAAGKWTADVTLHNTYNGSVHNIVARIAVGSENEKESNVLTVYYSAAVISVNQVTMYHNGTTVDLTAENTGSTKPTISFSPGRSFTFTADIENGNTLSEVYFVSTRGNERKTMKANYDSKTGLWIANGYFDKNNTSYVPGVISVEYKQNVNDISFDFSNAEINVQIEEFVDEFKNATVTIVEDTFTSEDSDGYYSSVIELADDEHTTIEYTIEQTTHSILNIDSTVSEFISNGYSEVTSADKNKRLFLKSVIGDRFDPEKCLTEYIELDLAHLGYKKIVSKGKSIIFDEESGFKTPYKIYKTGKKVIEVGNMIVDVILVKESILSSNLPESEKTARIDKLDKLIYLRSLYEVCGLLNKGNCWLMKKVCPPVGKTVDILTGLFFDKKDAQWDYIWDSVMSELINFDVRSVRIVIDPSGYVYEAVPSNRIEGVKTTVYFKDEDGNTILWDASEYDQDNPLYTDVYGRYSWDVPEGLWLVKYEKDGYETTYSDWLSVPPPQTDINVYIVSLEAPEVKHIEFYEEGAEIEFSQYMNISTVNEQTIVIANKGVPVTGTWSAINSEQSGTESGVSFATRFKFIPSTSFSGDYSISIQGVKNYSDLEIEDEYEDIFSVAIKPESISVPSNIRIEYGQSDDIVVKVLPVEAAIGKTITVSSNSTFTATVDSAQYTLDANGQATIRINGILPGNAEITISLDGTDLKEIINAEIYYSVEKVELTVGSQYRISGQYLQSILEGTTSEEFLTNFKNTSLVIIDADGNVVDLDDDFVVGTGLQVQALLNGIVNDELVVLIKGDTNGDGVIDVFDVFNMIDHINNDALLTGINKEAGLIVNDEEIDIFDTFAILDHINGDVLITQ